jgi:hypothetical protein
MSPLVTKFYAAEFAMVIWTLRKKGQKKRLTSKETKISEEKNDTQFFLPKRNE